MDVLDAIVLCEFFSRETELSCLLLLFDELSELLKEVGLVGRGLDIFDGGPLGADLTETWGFWFVFCGGELLLLFGLDLLELLEKYLLLGELFLRLRVLLPCLQL